MVGICFRCGRYKESTATLQIDQVDEIIHLCRNCLLVSPGELAHLSQRVREYLQAAYGDHVTFEVCCPGSSTSLSIILESLREIIRSGPELWGHPDSAT